MSDSSATGNSVNEPGYISTSSTNYPRYRYIVCNLSWEEALLITFLFAVGLAFLLASYMMRRNITRNKDYKIDNIAVFLMLFGVILFGSLLMSCVFYHICFISLGSLMMGASDCEAVAQSIIMYSVLLLISMIISAAGLNHIDKILKYFTRRSVATRGSYYSMSRRSVILRYILSNALTIIHINTLVFIQCVIYSQLSVKLHNRLIFIIITTALCIVIHKAVVIYEWIKRCLGYGTPVREEMAMDHPEASEEVIYTNFSKIARTIRKAEARKKENGNPPVNVIVNPMGQHIDNDDPRPSTSNDIFVL